MAAQSPSNESKNAMLGVVLGLIGILIFAGTLPATRIAVETYSAGFLTFGRALIAGIAAALCLLIMRKRFPATGQTRCNELQPRKMVSSPGLRDTVLTRVRSPFRTSCIYSQHTFSLYIKKTDVR